MISSLGLLLSGSLPGLAFRISLFRIKNHGHLVLSYFGIALILCMKLRPRRVSLVSKRRLCIYLPCWIKRSTAVFNELKAIRDVSSKSIFNQR